MSIYKTIKSIIQTNGFIGLWKGATPNMKQKPVLVNFGELATYEHAKKIYKKKDTFR